MPPVVLFVAELVVDAALSLGVGAATAAFIGNAIIWLGTSWIGTTIIGSLASMGITSALQGVLTPAPKRTLSFRQPITNHMLVYGQMKIGGPFTFIDTATDNGTLYLVLTIAGHPVKSIDGLYLNNTYVPLDLSGQAEKPIVWPDGTKPTDYRNHVTVIKGDGTVTGDAPLLAALSAASGKWGANFFQYSRAKVYIRLGWDQNLFGSTGVPNVSVVVRGRMVYDPRDTGTVILSSSPGSPGTFATNTPHGLIPGNMVFIKGHSGAMPVSAPFWPEAQRNAVAQEYEVATAPDGFSFTLYGIDSQPLALTSGGNGGTVTKMDWTDNSILTTRDYLVDPVHGMGVVYDTEVNQALDISGGNICDEIVPRILPQTTFTANPGTDEIDWVENLAVGPLPPLCQVMVTSTGSLPGGLAPSTPYFYAQTGGGPVGIFCATSDDAVHLRPINITSAGTGVQTLTIVESITFDDSKDELAVYDNALRITTGTEVLLSNVGGAPPAGLSSGGSYFAIFKADNVIQLAGTLIDARRGNAISFSGTGSGTSFVQVEAEPRFTCNGAIDTGETRQSIITKMLTSMSGYIVPSGVLLNLYPAAYITPTVVVDESDIRAPFSVTALTSGQTSFNSVKGTFVDPFSNGQPTDYPQLQNSTYIAQDNYEVVWKDLTLEFTNSNSMAQRIAKIELERVRRELTANMPLKLTAFQVGSPETIYIDNTMLGWSLETFEVQSWRFSINKKDDANTLDVDIVGRQTDAAVYAWTAAEEAASKRQTNTNLPNPFIVAPPTGLTLQSGTTFLVQQADGTIVSRIKVAWASPVDQFVLNGGFIEIWFKRSSESDWIAGEAVAGSQTYGYIENAQIGAQYDVAVRSRNGIGALSDQTPPFTTFILGYTVLGKSDAPSDISSITVTVNGLTITMAGSPITDTDVVSYEYRYGASSSWAGMTLIEQAPAVPNGSGGVAGVCTVGNIATGTWFFAVKALNRSGTYSINAAVSSPIGITNTLPNGAIPGGYITAQMFAAGIQPVLILPGAPPGVAGTYDGELAVSTTDHQLYRWIQAGAVWTVDVPVVNLTGQITTTQITPGAVTTPLLAANAVTAANIAANTITSGNIAADAIQAGQIAVGAVNSQFIIVNDIIVTGHLTTNAVTASAYAQAGSQTINNSGSYVQSSVVGIFYTSDGGDVLMQFTDYFIRSSGHSPTVKYTIYVDGNPYESIFSGGSGETFNIVTALNYLVTGIAAGGHTFSVYAGTDGTDPSCVSGAATLITSEFKDQR